MARVTRGGLPESWHLGAVAVCAAGGALLARVGDPEVETFIRSAAKPFQVLPLLAEGGGEAFALEPADVALICASHSGRPEHVERVKSLLSRGGFGPESLQCGAHRPTDPEAAATLRARGESPSALHNNCSGKHAGMLLACRLIGAPPDSYLDVDHPLQRRIRGLIAELCGLEDASLPVAVDGCSAPTFWMPLRAAALGFARLAAPGAGSLAPSLRAAATTVLESMAAAPEMVAGPARFTTRLLAATAGRVVGKEGAEGYYAVAVRGPEPLGLALKIADGADRSRDAVVLHLLEQLGVLKREELEALGAFRRPTLENHRRLEVGEIVAEVVLERPAAADRG